MKNKIILEKSDGRRCDFENKKCKKIGKVYSDDGGYICATCGGRVSKWLPVVNVIEEMMKDNYE